VATPEHVPWALSVSPQHFDEQLAVLQVRGRVERLEHALEASTLTRLGQRRPTFAITFDDGYVDNLVHALALLERHDAPATIFIVTGMLDEPTFWWDMLAELVFGCSIPNEELIESAIQLGLVADLSLRDEQSDLHSIHGLLYQALVPRRGEEIHWFLAELCARLDIEPPTPCGRPLTTEELEQLASHPLITIGIHTVHHRRLTLLPLDQVRTEVTAGARALDDLFGERRRVLAYPYGATSPAISELARATGVAYGVTTAGRWVGLREDSMLIPRLHPVDVDGEAFADWLSHA